MGVLSERENAETVGYPVIGEEEKETPSNVIDYQINKEITTGWSAVLNSNNDTTTGMATVIPGVNAPMLIETTSIYQNKEDIVGGATVSGALSGTRPYENTGTLRNWSIGSTYGNIKFENKTGHGLWNGLVIPSSGWYELYITYPLGSSINSVDMDLLITKGGYGNDVVVDSYHGPYSNVENTKRFRYHFEQGDTLYVSIKINYIGSSTEYGWNKYFTIAITKL